MDKEEDRQRQEKSSSGETRRKGKTKTEVAEGNGLKDIALTPFELERRYLTQLERKAREKPLFN